MMALLRHLDGAAAFPVEAKRLEKPAGFPPNDNSAQALRNRRLRELLGPKPDQSPSAKDGQEAAVPKLGPEIGAVLTVYSIAAFERVTAASAAAAGSHQGKVEGNDRQ
jgi:hypothetical protein